MISEKEHHEHQTPLLWCLLKETTLSIWEGVDKIFPPKNVQDLPPPKINKQIEIQYSGNNAFF